MKYKEEIDPVVAFVIPTAEFTKNNESKWVRALGEIGIIIPMLPYTIIALFIAAVFAVVVFIGASVLELIRSWWEDV